MQEISSNFNFIKSGNWPENVSAATGDVSFLCILIIFALFILASFVVILRHKLFSKAIYKASLVAYTEGSAIKKFIPLFITISVSILLALCALVFNETVANAANEEKLCSMADIEVVVNESGIESVSPAYLVNKSSVEPVSVDEIYLSSDDPSLTDSKWKITQDGVEVFNGSPGESKVLDKSLDFEPGKILKFDISITMDASKAVSLIGTSPVKFGLYVLNAYQEEAYRNIDESLLSFDTGLDILSHISDEAKADAELQVKQFALNAIEQINQTKDPDEIQSIMDQYNNSVLTLYKNLSTTNLDSYNTELTSLLSDSHNLTKEVKDVFKNSISDFYTSIKSNINSATNIDQLNTINEMGQDSLHNIKSEIEEAEANATWTVIFVPNGGTPAPASQDIKFGNILNEFDSPKITGKNLVGWYFTETFTSGTEWDLAKDKVGDKNAGDVDTCKLTLYAKWETAIYQVSLDANTGTPGTVTSVEVAYGSAMPKLETEGWMPTKEGNEFLGYFDNVSAGTKYYSADGTSAHVWDKEEATPTLYAHWKLITYTATIDLGEGKFSESSTCPATWTPVEGHEEKLFEKEFVLNTSVSDILGEWNGVVIVHEESPSDYPFLGFLPNTGSLTENMTFTAQFSFLMYQVCIWGIEQDDCGEGGSEQAHLTFGPATGSSSDCLDHNGHHEHCIHNDSWETIIDNIKVDPNCYKDCFEEGCTKTIQLCLNNKIGSMPQTKVMCSALSATSDNGCMNDAYLNWNASFDQYDNEGLNWATSRIRATLNGSTGHESSYAGNDCLSTSECLLSCFPKVLQENILSKYYQVPKTWYSSKDIGEEPYQILTSETILDKLWLPSGEEIYGNGLDEKYIPPIFKEYDRPQYQKKTAEGTTWTIYPNNVTYDIGGNPAVWWQRSPNRWINSNVGSVLTYGQLDYYTRTTIINSIAPCFCL